ncbi:Mucin [Phytophthora megakarya]|uniref:Mucin n=1 Tax=Phytophthora megakarya TaxID=4795 RepID=A0A225WMH9_9STRA|nr:Mucin [Phytophthora megakarya]
MAALPNSQTPLSTAETPVSPGTVVAESPVTSNPHTPSATSTTGSTAQPSTTPGFSTGTPIVDSPVATLPILADTPIATVTNPAQSPSATTTPTVTNPENNTPSNTATEPSSSTPAGTRPERSSSPTSSGSQLTSPSATTRPESDLSTNPSSANSLGATAVPATVTRSGQQNTGSSPVTNAPNTDSIANIASRADSASSSSFSLLDNKDVVATIKPSSTSTEISKDSSASTPIDEDSNSTSSLASTPIDSSRGISTDENLPLNRIRSTPNEISASSDHANNFIGNEDRDPATVPANDNSGNGSGNSEDEEIRQAIINLTHSLGPARDVGTSSVNILVGTAVTANVVSAVISIATTSASAVSNAATGVAASQGLLNVVSGGTAAASLGRAAPAVDLTELFMMLNYLQFISSNSHLCLPTAPDFFFQFTDSLGWSNLQPPVPNHPPPRSGGDDHSKEKLSSKDASNFTVADGDIISGVLAYAERINVKPEELFTKTAIVFVSVVGGVAAAVATLYSLLRLLLRRKLELLIQRLDDLPRAKLLMRLLIQSCLSICLLSEYALSMTSSFQMRYNEQEHGSHSAFAFATVALIFVCCGLIVLGVVKIWSKNKDELSNPDFKFAWGAYYKYYHFENRYFFVAKMGAEILSGVIIGLVSDVPSQLTLLMSLQLAMFLYTIESAPYTMEFQTVCSSIAFVMKMVTYALISSFLTPSTDVSLQNFVGTLVIVLQVILLILFNSRQLYILYKQMKYLWELRQHRLQCNKEMTNEKDDAMVIRNSDFAHTAAPAAQVIGAPESKRDLMIIPSTQYPVAAC